jgi:uncharacterized protein
MNRIYRYPRSILAVIGLLTLFFLYHLPNIIVNNDLYIFLGENNQAKLDNDAVEEIFGESDAMLVAMHSRYEKISSPENLRLIDSLSREFERLERVTDVISLSTADYIEGTDEGMSVQPLIPENLLESGNEADLIQRLRSWDAMYRKNLYSDDFYSTQILLEIEADLSMDDLGEVYEEVREVIDRYPRNGIKYHIAGVPAILVLLKNSIYSDLANLIPIVIVVVMLTLYLSFRRAAGVFLPLLNVAIASIWTIGLMAFLEVPLTMVGVGIPVILISVGSAYGIHLLSHTYDEMGGWQGDFPSLILHIIKKVGWPVTLAGLTTIAGFGSLSTSAIVPMREAGLFLAFGVLVSLVLALLMIPAILLLKGKPIKKRAEKERTRDKLPLIDRFLLAFYDVFTKHNVRNLLLASAILALAIMGTSKIIVDTNMIGNFRETTDIAIADAFQNEHFGGTTMLSIVIDGGEKGSLLRPEILKAMDDLAQYLENDVPLVGKVSSFTEFVKRMNQIMNRPSETVIETDFTEAGSISDEESSFSFDDLESESSFSFDDFQEESGFAYEEDDATETAESAAPSNVTFPKITPENVLHLLNQAAAHNVKSEITATELLFELNRLTNTDGMAYYEIPWEPAKYPAETRAELKNLISQYLLLYSGSLDGFINDPLEPSMSRMIIQIKSPLNADAAAVEALIMAYVHERFPKDYQVKITGTGKMAASVNDLVMSSQTSSIISSLIIVFAIIAWSFRSFVAGFYGIVTLVFSLMINFGVMGFFGIKLDMGTSMVASVAIGIGIDYTIHFLSRYKLEAQKESDLQRITQRTLLTAGKAIFFNAIAVAAGFAVLIKSSFIPIENLGILVALTMITSSLGALTLLPAMLNTFKPKFVRKIDNL